MAIRSPRWLSSTIAPISIGLLVAVAIPSSVCRADWSTVVNSGDPANRVDIVFLGDGYTQANLNAGLYTSHIENYLDHMFAAPGFLADPFPRYRNFFNIHKINVVSQQSGADDPIPNGIYRNTALGAAFDTEGIDRLLGINEVLADPFVAAFQSGAGITADIQMVTVNDSQYGGSGGDYAVFAGGNDEAREIALHELSHAFSDTADEYVTINGSYSGPEPGAVNATKLPTGQKWSHWLGYDDPRHANLDIGVFQGGMTYSQGIYRPSLDSKMNTLSVPFNAVVREKSILDIYALVDPLDGWLNNATTVEGGELWVDVVDPAVISVDWFVNNQKVASNHGEYFDLADFVSLAGTYSVRAHAYDGIVTQVGNGSLLDLVRKDLNKLQQKVVWTVDFIPAIDGDYNFDHVVDDLDYSVWRTSFGSDDQLAADGNDNGIVDLADYTVWRDNLSRQLPASSVVDHPAPEPTTLGLIFAAVFYLGLHTRVRRVTPAAVFSDARCI